MAEEIIKEDDVIEDDTTHDDQINSDEPTDAFLKAFDEIEADPELDQDDEGQQEPDPEATDNTDDKEGEEDPIPDAWVEAGRAAGLKDDEIESLAGTTPKVLEALVERKVVEAPPEADPEPEDEAQPDPNILPHVEFEIPEGVDESTKKLFEQMAGTQNTLVDKLNEAHSKITGFEDVSIRQEQAAVAARDKQIDDFMDSQIENCPTIGKNETLTDAQLEVRKEVFGLSERVHGDTLEDKLEKAIKAYNGIHGTAEKNLARKLYKNKQRFSPRPQGRKTKQQFKNADEKAMNAFNEKAKDLGIDFE